MTPHDPPSDKGARRPSGPRRREVIAVARRETAQGVAWEIVQPRCARKRRVDFAEVDEMGEAGEIEIARDELVWLLSECPDFLEGHVHLGLIAMEEDDLKLARGHFGRAYELCLRAFEAASNPQPIPYDLPGNRPFHEAAKGLVHCLLETGRRKVAQDVCRRIAPLDPTDPLGIARLLSRP
jgi:hypothetical protein